MSIKSSLSLLLILVASQVSCHLIKMELTDAPNKTAEKEFQESEDKVPKETTDKPKNNLNQSDKTAGTGSLFRGVKISFGKPSQKSDLQPVYLSSAGLTCLNDNQSIKVLTTFTYTDDIPLIFYVKTNSEKYIEKKLPLEINADVDISKLCFTVGHLTPDVTSDNKTIQIYIHIFTEKEYFIDLKKLWTLSIQKFVNFADIKLKETANIYTESMITNDESNPSEVVSSLECLIKEQHELKFTINTNTYSIAGEGVFNMNFFDVENLETVYNEAQQAILKRIHNAKNKGTICDSKPNIRSDSIEYVFWSKSRISKEKEKEII